MTMADTGDLVAAELEAPGLLAVGIQHRVAEHVHRRDLTQHQLTRPDGASNYAEQEGNNQGADLLCGQRRTCSAGAAATGRFLSADEGTDGPGWWLTKPVAAGAVHDNVDERSY
jgi:hypothetical protein